MREVVESLQDFFFLVYLLLRSQYVALITTRLASVFSVVVMVMPEEMVEWLVNFGVPKHCLLWCVTFGILRNGGQVYSVRNGYGYSHALKRYFEGVCQSGLVAQSVSGSRLLGWTRELCLGLS